VYFINMAGANQVQFAVPYFNMFDPRLPDHPVPVAVRGNITFKITDPREFTGLHALVDFDMGKFSAKIKSAVVDFVQSAMMDIMQNNKMVGCPLIQINTYRRDVRGMLEDDLKRSLASTYGVTLAELNLTAIEIDEESPDYAQLAKLTKNIVTAQIETQAELSIRGMHDQYDLNKANLEAQSAIGWENLAESARINREEGQYAQHMQTDMGGFALHQLRQQEEIAKSAVGHRGQTGRALSACGNFAPHKPGSNHERDPCLETGARLLAERGLAAGDGRPFPAPGKAVHPASAPARRFARHFACASLPCQQRAPKTAPRKNLGKLCPAPRRTTREPYKPRSGK
jgi:hypothetical protein